MSVLPIAEYDYHVGLDFGTSQTKVCILNLRDGDGTREFLPFKKRGVKAPEFCLPSTLALKDGCPRCGFEALASAGVTPVFRYFKMAAAEDAVFRLVTGHSAATRVYDLSDYAPHTPEVLAVVYLTYVLLLVAEHLTKAKTAVKVAGFFKKSNLNKAENSKPANAPAPRFSVQLGVPTEYSSKIQQARFRKFETMLLLAKRLSAKLGTLERFRTTSLQSTQDWLRTETDALLPLLAQPGKWEDAMNLAGASVCAESAAGLQVLVASSRLTTGYYASLDIGGGSTDVSFFRVDQAKKQVHYLASESLLKASNDVYRHYAVSQGVAGVSASDLLNTAEGQVRSLIAQVGAGVGKSDDDYRAAIESLTGPVERLLKKLYASRVIPYFPAGIAVAQLLEGKPCFVYGGGAALPVSPNGNHIQVWDGGNAAALNGVRMLRTPVFDHLSVDTGAWDVALKAGPSENVLPVLVVAVGLSFLPDANRTSWSNDEFKHAANPTAIPHPFNPGYVYDVVARNWLGQDGSKIATALVSPKGGTNHNVAVGAKKLTPPKLCAEPAVELTALPTRTAPVVVSGHATPGGKSQVSKSAAKASATPAVVSTVDYRTFLRLLGYILKTAGFNTQEVNRLQGQRQDAFTTEMLRALKRTLKYADFKALMSLKKGEQVTIVNKAIKKVV